MMGMARAGGGQQYYGQTAEDRFDGFDEELALLQVMFLRHLRLKLIPGPGVVVEPLGLVQRNDDGSLTLSDLAWAAESWLLVRLQEVQFGEAGMRVRSLPRAGVWCCCGAAAARGRRTRTLLGRWIAGKTGYGDQMMRG